MAEEYTLAIEAAEHREELTVPAAAVDVLGEGQQATEVAGDLILLGLAQQLHGLVHHSEEPVTEDIEEATDEVMEAFEDRFGLSFGEMTGHDH